MKRFFAFVAISSILAGCGGGGSRAVPAVQPGGPPGLTPSMSTSLMKVPASKTFDRPTLPAALRQLQIPSLSPAAQTAMLVQRTARGATRSTQARSAAFFANEVFVGNDANGFATYWMADFGFYTYGSKTQGAIPFPGFLYKYNFAWLYDLGPTSAGASDAYFFDFGAPDGDVGVWYTAPSYGTDANNMYLYDFMLGHFMMYQQNSAGPRWFFDFTANKWLNGNLPMTEAVGGASGFVNPDNHKTLYYLDVDSASSQMCTGACLSSWPVLPVIPDSSATSDLTMTERADGTGKQWMYQGHPLYTFVGDGNAADGTSGDGIPDFGGHWHVARPAGTVVPPQPTDPPCNFYC